MAILASSNQVFWIESGGSVDLTLTLNDLLAVVQDPNYSNPAAVERVIISYKNQDHKKILTFTAENNVDTVSFSPFARKGDFHIISVTIIDLDNGTYTLNTSEMSSISSDFDFIVSKIFNLKFDEPIAGLGVYNVIGLRVVDNTATTGEITIVGAENGQTFEEYSVYGDTLPQSESYFIAGADGTDQLAMRRGFVGRVTATVRGRVNALPAPGGVLQVRVGIKSEVAVFSSLTLDSLGDFTMTVTADTIDYAPALTGYLTTNSSDPFAETWIGFFPVDAQVTQIGVYVNDSLGGTAGGDSSVSIYEINVHASTI